MAFYTVKISIEKLFDGIMKGVVDVVKYKGVRYNLPYKVLLYKTEHTTTMYLRKPKRSMY